MTDDIDSDTDGEQTDEPDFDQGRQDAVSTGVKIRGKLKRGTATRDQDEIVIEGRAGSAEDAVQKFETALVEAEKRGWDQRLRDLQPDGDADD